MGKNIEEEAESLIAKYSIKQDVLNEAARLIAEFLFTIEPFNSEKIQPIEKVAIATVLFGDIFSLFLQRAGINFAEAVQVATQAIILRYKAEIREHPDGGVMAIAPHDDCQDPECPLHGDNTLQPERGKLN